MYWRTTRAGAAVNQTDGHPWSSIGAKALGIPGTLHTVYVRLSSSTRLTAQHGDLLIACSVEFLTAPDRSVRPQGVVP